jgi:GNAT superfamily N-acetyltransferase
MVAPLGIESIRMSDTNTPKDESAFWTSGRALDNGTSDVLFLPARGVNIALILLALEILYNAHFDLPHDDGCYSGEGLIARRNDELVGVAIFIEATAEDLGQKNLFLYGGVVPSWRRLGIGATLVQRALQAARSERESGVVIASLAPTDVTPAGMALPVQGLWSKLGFEVMDVQVTFLGYVTSQQPEPTASPMTAGVYAGGDDARDAAIVDMTNRMLKRAGVPALSLADLHYNIRQENHVVLLVDYGPRLAAAATLIFTDDNCLVETLVVDRAFWGRGTSDMLCWAVMRLAHERGCRTFHASVAKTNTAVQAVMRRFGWEPVHEITRMRCRWP